MIDKFVIRLGIDMNRHANRRVNLVMNYYKTKHCYSVYQNAISEYLRPLPLNNDDSPLPSNNDDSDSDDLELYC